MNTALTPSPKGPVNCAPELYGTQPHLFVCGLSRAAFTPQQSSAVTETVWPKTPKIFKTLASSRSNTAIITVLLTGFPVHTVT